MTLSLRQLSYFVALAEEGSFRAAALRVHVTQPALSMQMRDLEEKLGVELVERQARGIRVTRAGQEVLARARVILADVAGLQSHARRLGGQLRIRLGIIPTIAPYLLPPALASLRDGALQIDLRVREATTGLLLAGLDAGALDAIIIALPFAGLKGTTGHAVHPLFHDRFLLASTGPRLAALGAMREELRPVALDPDQLLLLDEGHCLADQALDVCGIDRGRLRLDVGASSLSTLCGLVGQGMGLTFLPELAVASETAAVPDMALARFAEPQPGRDVALVMRSRDEAEPWVADLVRVLQTAGGALLDVAQARETGTEKGRKKGREKGTEKGGPEDAGPP